MYITRDEAIVTLHDLMNSGILDSDLCDELNDIRKGSRCGVPIIQNKIN